MKRFLLVTLLAGSALSVNAGEIIDKAKVEVDKVGVKVADGIAEHREKALVRQEQRSATAINDAALDGTKHVTDTAINGGDVDKAAAKANAHYNKVAAKQDKKLAKANYKADKSAAHAHKAHAKIGHDKQQVSADQQVKREKKQAKAASN